jgi:protein involved in polysaccharide export with SLBB domain
MTSRVFVHGTVVASLLLALVGCVSSKTAPIGETASAYAADNPQQALMLPLAAGDKIRVTVYGEDRISGEYQIDPDGMISLPLAGTIMAAGLTKPALETALADKLAGKYLRNPKVTVDVVTFRPFYVLGEVQKPGEYPFRSGLNVLSAIAIAGGTTYRANTSKVYIQRFGSTDLVEFAQSPTITVMPGDVVRVPERYF